ncbi:hypothetical protein ABE10_03290, partial [Bacillus toyonensis]|nr:hypothetical protein [Bacillus toyonensis]
RLVHLEGASRGVGEPEERDRVRQGLCALHLAGERREIRLLRSDAAEVAAIADPIARADERQRLVALDRVPSCGEVQPRVRVVDVLREADVDSSDSVRDVDEAVEVHHHEVVDVEAGVGADGVERAVRADVEGAVDLRRVG